MAGRVRHHEVRGVQHQDQSAHVLVYVAPQRHESRIIENDRRDRPFLRTITAKIKSLGWRIGKNIVIRVIEIWKLNPGSHFYRQKRWNKRQIFLRNLFRWQRRWSREVAIEINHGEWRLGGEDSGFGHDLVAFRLDRCRMRFRKLNASLNSRARKKRNGNDRKNGV